MPDCTGYLTDNITYDCANAPVGGIEQNIVLINKDDIDVTSITTVAENDMVIATVSLK